LCLRQVRDRRPSWAATEEDVVGLLRPLTEAFKLPSAEKVDTQELVYAANKCFAHLFPEQSAALEAVPYGHIAPDGA
jgi:hypothetical protein